MLLPLLVLLFAILLGATGQIALKTGVNLLGEKPAVGVVLKSILTPWVFAGFTCYAMSSLLYLMALSRLDLSYAYPLVALSYVIVTFLSWKFLGETVPLLRVAGLAVVCMGVVIVALSYRGMAPADARDIGPPPLESSILPEEPPISS